MQTNRHLIALDLDGTLLTDKKEISAQTKQIVLRQSRRVISLSLQLVDRIVPALVIMKILD
jgi:histidinol phosphatase-like enzyme